MEYDDLESLDLLLRVGTVDYRLTHFELRSLTRPVAMTSKFGTASISCKAMFVGTWFGEAVEIAARWSYREDSVVTSAFVDSLYELQHTNGEIQLDDRVEFVIPEDDVTRRTNSRGVTYYVVPFRPLTDSKVTALPHAFLLQSELSPAVYEYLESLTCR